MCDKKFWNMSATSKVWKRAAKYRCVVWVWPYTGRRAWRFRPPPTAHLFCGVLGSVLQHRWHTRLWCGDEVKDLPQFIWLLVDTLEDLECLGSFVISEAVQLWSRGSSEEAYFISKAKGPNSFLGGIEAGIFFKGCFEGPI